MTKKISLTFAFVATIVILTSVALVLWVQWRRNVNPVIALLREPDNRPRILADLITKNAIVDLPSEFRISESKDIKCDSFKYSDEYAFVVASVVYPVSLSGSRLHTFFFHVSGKCVFHSPDDLDAWDFARSLGDLTGDGKPEKMVKYFRYEVGKTQDSSDPLGDAFQIWRISPENSELLLHVKYKAQKGMDPCDLHPKLVWPRFTGNSKVSDDGVGRPKMWLVSDSEGPKVEFYWSQKNQKFETKKPTGDLWEVIFPCEPKPDVVGDPQTP